MEKTRHSASTFILLLDGGEQAKAVAELQNVDHFTKSDIRDLASLLSPEPLEHSHSDYKLALLRRTKGQLKGKNPLDRIEAYERGMRVVMKAIALDEIVSDPVAKAIEEVSSKEQAPDLKNSHFTDKTKQRTWGISKVRKDYERFRREQPELYRLLYEINGVNLPKSKKSAIATEIKDFKVVDH